MTAENHAHTRLKLRRSCIVCGKEKAASEFYLFAYTTNQGKRSERLEPRCRPCARARRKERTALSGGAEAGRLRAARAKNREAYNAWQRERRVINQDRLRVQRRAYEAKRRAVTGDATSAVVIRVLEEARVGSRYLDAYTSELISNPTIDHIIPLSAGGPHDYWNLCVTSKENNSSKHVRPLLAWLAQR